MRTLELLNDARPCSDAQFSSQPPPLRTVDPALESSLDGLSDAAKDVQHLPLLLAQHRDKVQQDGGGVAQAAIKKRSPIHIQSPVHVSRKLCTA